jgi:hypothetical protein
VDKYFKKETSGKINYRQGNLNFRFPDNLERLNRKILKVVKLRQELFEARISSPQGPATLSRYNIIATDFAGGYLL